MGLEKIGERKKTSIILDGANPKSLLSSFWGSIMGQLLITMLGFSIYIGARICLVHPTQQDS